MTMRTRDRIVCDCGHQGSLCCAENDQPYSSLWESYSLELSRPGRGRYEQRRKAEKPACGHAADVPPVRPNRQGALRAPLLKHERLLGEPAGAQPQTSKHERP